MDLNKLTQLIEDIGLVKLILLSMAATLILNLLLPFPLFIFLFPIPLLFWLTDTNR